MIINQWGMRRRSVAVPLTSTTSPGAMVLTGRRRCSVPAADKGIVMHSGSDLDGMFIWHTARQTQESIPPSYHYLILYVSAASAGVHWLRARPSHTQRAGLKKACSSRLCLLWSEKPLFLWVFLSLLKPAHTQRNKTGFPRGKDGRNALLLCLWEEPMRGHVDQWEVNQSISYRGRFDWRTLWCLGALSQSLGKR